MPFKYSKNLKVNFLCQIKFKSNFILSKKIKSNQIKFLGLWFVLQIFFQIICFNKNKTNQIKSNLWDNVFYFKFFSNFSLQQKLIKSNHIKFLGSWFVFQIFFKFLGLCFNLPNQIKSNFVAIIWLVKLKQMNLIWFDLNHF